MPRVGELLDRESQTVDLESGDFERLLRRRERKLRNRRLRSGAVALVVTLLTAAILLRSFSSAPIPADRPVQPSPSQALPVDVTFPMFSADARPSTPVTGEQVLGFQSWGHASFPVVVGIYADGRVIWHPEQHDVGYLQVRLTPRGVETIRSMVISTGLVDGGSGLRVHAGPTSRLQLRRGDRTVEVDWSNAGEKPTATPAQAHAVTELERFLGDPSAWQLPSGLYADPKIRTFVPFGFQFDFDRSGPDLSQLPSPAREVMTRLTVPWHGKCDFVTSDQARELVEALARAGFAPLTNSPVYVDFKIPGPHGPSNPHLTPALPDDVRCLVKGDG
jgi:hypothetical protein